MEALIVSTILTVGGSAINARVQAKAQKKATLAANKRSKAELDARKVLANQSKAPVESNEGIIDLKSPEALKDSAIKNRSKKSRLRIKKGSSGINVGSSKVGTGLKVG